MVAACLEYATISQSSDESQSQQQLPIVAVGIGTGGVEGKIRELLHTKLNVNNTSPKWYGVDPAPTSFDPNYPSDGVFLDVDAPTVPVLLQKHPELVQNCVLLLIWCDFDKDYDMEAVELLRPCNVVSITEAGCAGHPKKTMSAHGLSRASMIAH